MRIDASHEFGAETWEQRARACAAELEEAKMKIKRIYEIFHVADEPLDTVINMVEANRRIWAALQGYKE